MPKLSHLKTFEHLKKYLPHFREVKTYSDLNGAHNKVFFGYAKVLVTTDKDAKGSALSIAILCPSEKNTEEEIQASYNAMDLLRNVNKNKDAKEKQAKPAQSLSSPFIQRLLFMGKQGKVSVRAYKDLRQFLGELIEEKRNKFLIHGKEVQVDVKEMVSQLILAVQALHIHGLVHRDIKPENFLVTIDDQGNVCIELTDLDTIGRADDKSLLYAGTLGFFPEKFEEFIEKLQPFIIAAKYDFEKLNMLYRYIDKVYQGVDKLHFDCYALGATLNELAKDFPHISDKNRQSLVSLADALKHSRNLQKTVMDHDFFGQTVQERLAYFYKVNAKFTRLKQTIFYDTYYQSPHVYYPEREDSFWLLPRYLKDIYAIAENLENQITFFNDDNFLNKKNNDISTHLAIQRKTEQLIQSIDNVLHFISLSSIVEKSLLIALREEANTILRGIKLFLAIERKRTAPDSLSKETVIPRSLL